MGYQDGMGLRQGRTREKTAGSRSNSLSSAFSPSTGYRAAGMVSPVRQAEPTSVSALSQYGAQDYMPEIPKASGLLQTIGTGAATYAAGRAMDKGIDKGIDYLGKGIDYGLGKLGIETASPEMAGNIGDFFAVDANYGGAAGAEGAAAGGMDLTSGLQSAGYGIAGREVAKAAGANDIWSGVAGGAAAGASVGGPVGALVGGAIGGITSAAGCFITEATMAGLGVQDDNAEPLKVLRFFRDNVLAGTPEGQAMIEEYESIAPLVVQALEFRPDAMEVFKQIFEQFIVPAVEAVKSQNYPQALQIYAAMIQAVTPLAQEAMAMEDEAQPEGVMQEMQEMQEMGDDAGMVAQNPMVAQEATAMPSSSTMSGLQNFNADEYPSSIRFGRR